MPRLGRIVFALALALALLGCGEERDPATLVFLIESSPTNLDPRVGTDAQSARIGQLIFSSLLRRNRNLDLVPDLAEDWELRDPRTYVFRLRRGIRFHDGRVLTSADVKYTFESLLDDSLTSIKTGTYRRIEKIEAPVDDTVIFRLKEPYVHFPLSLSNGAIGIVPQGSGKDFSSQPVGTGPYRFVSVTPDQNVILEKYEAYFGPAAKVARVEFRVVPDSVTRALELEKGSADVTINSLTADMAETLRGRPNLKVMQTPGTNYAYLAFNLQDPILKKRKVRQAVAHALDRDAIIRFLWRNTVRPALSILPPVSWAYEDDVRTYPYDPARAEKLLEEAGYPRRADGVRFTLTHKTSTDETARLKAEIFQAQLAEVGIDIEIRSYDFATFYSNILDGRFQLYSLRWIGANNFPEIFNYLFSSASFPPGGANRGRYRNPRVDTLLDTAQKTFDPAGQKKIYREVQRILAADLPYVHLWHFDNLCVFHRRLENVRPYPAGDYDFITEIDLHPLNHRPADSQKVPGQAHEAK